MTNPLDREYCLSPRPSLQYTHQHSNLTYACQIWGQNQNIHNQKIFTLQNTALRIMSFSNFFSTSSPLYASFKILKLKDLITLKNCLFVYDSLNKLTPLSFHEYFKNVHNIHQIKTKSASLGCVYVTASKTKRYGLNSVTKRCISDWNMITKKFHVDLLSLTRHKLVSSLSQYFLQSYL